MTRHAFIQFYSAVATALPSKRRNLTNMTSNKADAIPEELKSCALETIEERYPANDWLHIYTDSSYLPEANGAGADWFCRLFEVSLDVGKNATNYDDSQAATLASSSNKPTDSLNTIQSAELKLRSSSHMAELRPYSGSQVMLDSTAMKKPTKKPSREPSQPEVPLTLRRAKSIISTH
ncbi:reverse transcriptase [Trichonephila clavipes]|nr:reverse transcriptase [Trichonephila clavipes]